MNIKTKIESIIVGSYTSILASIFISGGIVFSISFEYLPENFLSFTDSIKKHSEAFNMTVYAVLIYCLGIIYFLKRPGFKVNFNSYLKGLEKSKVAIERIAENYRDVDSNKSGLSHYLGVEGSPPTSLSTTYGAKALLISSKLNYLGYDKIVGYLESVKLDCGSWNAASQNHAAPEVTAEIVNFYAQVHGVGSERYVQSVISLRRIITGDSSLLSNTLAVTSILENLPSVDEELNDLKRMLANKIFHGFKENANGCSGWGWELQADINTTNEIMVSVSATARCLIAIGYHRDLCSEPSFKERASKAMDWLLKQEGYPEEFSEINRIISLEANENHARTDILTFKHFSSALVLIAACKWKDLEHSDILAVKALEEVIGEDSTRPWSLSDGRTPVWMSYQGIQAISMYGEALAFWSGNDWN